MRGASLGSLDPISFKKKCLFDTGGGVFSPALGKAGIPCFSSQVSFHLQSGESVVHAGKDTYPRECVTGKGRCRTAFSSMASASSAMDCAFVSVLHCHLVVCNCLQFHCHGLLDHRFDVLRGREEGEFDLKIIFWQYIPI